MFYILNSNQNYFNDLFEGFENIFNSKTQKDSNKNDSVEKSDKEFILSVALPGFKKEEVQISTENNMLKIYAKRNKKIGWLQEEFKNSYQLEDNIDIEKITAKLEDGILSITLPFKEKTKPNIITIQ
jgi:HSP20 family protein